MLDLTFLTEEQIFGDNKLVIFEKYGTKCAITDFAILLGGSVSSDYHTDDGSKKDRTGWWWTKTKYKTKYEDYVRAVSRSGDISWGDADARIGGVRPALPYSSISTNIVRGSSGIKEILYGEYPQWVIDESYSREVERAYNSENIKTTGKSYTTDSVDFQDYDKSFKPRSHIEYEYNGEKFIRFVGDLNCNGKVLSDGRIIKSRNVYWVRVEPIIWLVDERANIAFSKHILASGLQFNNTNYYGYFENTDIKRFMDNYLSKEIIANANTLNTGVNIKTNSTDNIDDIFTEAINRMNEINSAPKTKILK